MNVILNVCNMKRLSTIIILAAVLLAACGDSEKQLEKRAAELCQYIPDHELLEKSKGYMTEDFYAVLDTLFYRLPEFEAMDHEWLHYFVTGNGGTMADCSVVGVEKTDNTHAVATISVRQKWEDGSFDESTDIEEHKLYMEKVNGVWLMSDFDGYKADCIRHIAISRDEQAMRDAIGEYLVNVIGTQYQQGEICVPTLFVVTSERPDSASVSVLCDCWVHWYNKVGNTLKCVSGGNHSGLMRLDVKNGKYTVGSFEQTVDGAGNEASAKRIFGSYYDVYQNGHSNEAVREAIRKEQTREYLRRNNIDARFYQDYGWPAVDLFESE